MVFCWFWVLEYTLKIASKPHFEVTIIAHMFLILSYQRNHHTLKTRAILNDGIFVNFGVLIYFHGYDTI
jgi:hypothetical protein